MTDELDDLDRQLTSAAARLASPPELELVEGRIKEVYRLIRARLLVTAACALLVVWMSNAHRLYDAGPIFFYGLLEGAIAWATWLGLREHTLGQLSNQQLLDLTERDIRQGWILRVGYLVPLVIMGLVE